MLILALAIACSGDGDTHENPGTDDTGTPVDDSATPVDDSATGGDDSATVVDDSATGGDDSATGGDDSGTVPGTFEVVLTPNPNMVTQVSAAITLSVAHPLKVVCEAPTTDPWAERSSSATATRRPSTRPSSTGSSPTRPTPARSRPRACPTARSRSSPRRSRPRSTSSTRPCRSTIPRRSSQVGRSSIRRCSRPARRVRPRISVVDPMGRIRWYFDMQGEDGDAVFEYDVPSGSSTAAGVLPTAAPPRVGRRRKCPPRVAGHRRRPRHQEDRRRTTTC